MSTHPLRAVLGFLEGLGAPSDEDTADRVNRQLVVFGGALMSLGGLAWGTLTLSQGLLFACSIPYGYAALTVLNFAWLARARRLAGPKVVQVLMSLLLPFFFQWSLGGFVHSGGVMLWSIIALVGSLTFSTARQASVWLVMYCVLTIGSGFIDARLEAMRPSRPARS